MLFAVIAVHFQCVFADTVYLKDGSSQKGIVVEDYRDRVVISTEYGETLIEKKEIRKIDFDLPEQNLVSMAKQYLQAKKYNNAYYYYKRAAKINPDYKEAAEGVSFLEGMLFRKELNKKAEEVGWLQEVEDFRTKKNKIEIITQEKQLADEVGVKIDDSKEGFTVAKVFAGSPGKKAGLRKGDLVIAIWGKLVGYLTIDEFYGLVLESGHLEIKIQIRRQIGIPARKVRTSMFQYGFEGLYFINIDEGSNLYSRGIRNNDMLEEIDGSSVRYMPLSNVMSLLNVGQKHEVTVKKVLTIWRQIKE